MVKTGYKTAMLLAIGLIWGAGAKAEEDATVNLHCVIAACSPQEICKTKFDLGDYSFNIDAGNEFVFQVTDHWTVSQDGYRLDNMRFNAEGYRLRTTVNIDFNRATKALSLSIVRLGTGVKTIEVASTGSCEITKSHPIIF